MQIVFDSDISQNLLRLLAAYIIALPVAWNREKGARRNAGLRTFPLVALASCGYMLVGMQVLDTTDAESRVVNVRQKV